jgi:Flp pilus assembly protein TadD
MLIRIIFCILVAAIAGCANQSENQKAETLSSLGDVYARSNHFVEAENYYSKAQDIEPDKLNLRMKIADAQVQQGKYIEAIHSYRQIISLDPKNDNARYSLARVSMLRGDMNTAYIQYSYLLQQNRKNTRALNGMGVLLDNLSKNHLAQSCYRKGLSYTSQDAALQNNLGVSFALSGNLKEARYYLMLSLRDMSHSRQKENLKLINGYFAKIKDPVLRKKQLDDMLLVKSGVATPALVNKTMSAARKWCV